MAFTVPIPMDSFPVAASAEDIARFLRRHKPHGMTLRLLAEEVNTEFRKVGVVAPKVCVNTVWRWKKGIHQPDEVRATMLRRVMERWDKRDA